MIELEKILEEIQNLEYPSVGIACGLEYANITDRYESAAYGWNEAVKRICEILAESDDCDWIPVKEGLPEPEAAIIATIVDTKGKQKVYVDICHYKKAGKYVVWFDMDDLPVIVTAWKPLPFPYKKRELYDIFGIDEEEE